MFCKGENPEKGESEAGRRALEMTQAPRGHVVIPGRIGAIRYPQRSKQKAAPLPPSEREGDRVSGGRSLRDFESRST